MTLTVMLVQNSARSLFISYLPYLGTYYILKNKVNFAIKCKLGFFNSISSWLQRTDKEHKKDSVTPIARPPMAPATEPYRGRTVPTALTWPSRESTATGSSRLLQPLQRLVRLHWSRPVATTTKVTVVRRLAIFCDSHCHGSCH